MAVRVITAKWFREVADSLRSVGGENKEYDRALDELTAFAIGDGESELQLDRHIVSKAHRMYELLSRLARAGSIFALSRELMNVRMLVNEIDDTDDVDDQTTQLVYVATRFHPDDETDAVVGVGKSDDDIVDLVMELPNAPAKAWIGGSILYVAEADGVPEAYAYVTRCSL